MARLLSPFIWFYLFLKKYKHPKNGSLRGTFRAVLMDSIVAQKKSVAKGGKRKKNNAVPRAGDCVFLFWYQRL
jgi:hypothetical protein